MVHFIDQTHKSLQSKKQGEFILQWNNEVIARKPFKFKQINNWTNFILYPLKCIFTNVYTLLGALLP